MEALSTVQFEAALKTTESEDATPEEQAEMLIKVAMGLSHKPKTACQIEEAIELYRRATEFCPPQAGALRARARVRVRRGQQPYYDLAQSSRRN